MFIKYKLYTYYTFMLMKKVFKSLVHRKIVQKLFSKYQCKRYFGLNVGANDI